MSIFLKSVLKSMFEKKGRLFLLIFAISISTALLIACAGIISTITNVFETSKKATAEGKDIAIVSNNEDAFFNVEEIQVKGLTNTEGQIRVNGVVKEDSLKYVTVIGKDMENIRKYKVVDGSLEDLTANSCMICQRISLEKNIKLNDNIAVYINGERHDFRIAAISSDSGLFYLDVPTQFSIIVNSEYLAEFYNQPGKYNFATANMEAENAEAIKKELNGKTGDFKRQRLFFEEATTRQVEQMSSGLYVMFAIVLLISIIIIYGALKLTITERLPIIGTFFSQGATYRKVERILFIESIGYGFMGGLVGCVLGTVFLYGVNYSLSPLAKYGIREPFVLNSIYLILGMAFAIILSSLSAIAPIRKIRKLSVKNVILNITTEKSKGGLVRFFIGLALLMVGAVCAYTDASWTIDYSVICLFAGIIGLIMVYREVVDIVTDIFRKMARGKNNILFLALNNVKTCGVLTDGIVLVMIALLCSIIIGSTVSSLGRETFRAYSLLNYDLSINNITADNTNESKTDRIIEELENLDGIDVDTINPFVFISGTVDGMETTVSAAMPERFSGYSLYLELETRYKDLYSKFTDSNGKDIIISEMVLKKLKKNIGDRVKIVVNDVEDEYRIMGAIDGKSFNVGNFVIMNLNQYRNSYGLKEVFAISCKVKGDVKTLKDQVSEIAAQYGAICTSREDDLKVNLEESEKIILMMSIFSYLAIIIAAIGLLNNIAIVFLQRKKDFAVLSSVGMTSGKRAKLLIIESLVVVFCGCLLVLSYLFIIMGILVKLMDFLTVNINLILDVNSLPIYCLVTAIIVVAATIPVVRKSRKMSIVQEIKYE